jgi:hypothetical protein
VPRSLTKSKEVTNESRDYLSAIALDASPFRKIGCVARVAGNRKTYPLVGCNPAGNTRLAIGESLMIAAQID